MNSGCLSETVWAAIRESGGQCIQKFQQVNWPWSSQKVFLGRHL